MTTRDEETDKAIESKFGEVVTEVPKVTKSTQTPRLSRKKLEVKIGDNEFAEAQDVHCAGCGRFVGFQVIVWGLASWLCPNCGKFTTIEVNPEKGDLDNIPGKS